MHRRLRKELDILRLHYTVLDGDNAVHVRDGDLDIRVRLPSNYPFRPPDVSVAVDNRIALVCGLNRRFPPEIVDRIGDHLRRDYREVKG